MKTTNKRQSGFALGTILVLSLIMMIAVAALLGYASSEHRAAYRNHLATEAFHQAENGIEFAVDALDSEANKKWANPLRYHKEEGNTVLDVYIKDEGGNPYKYTVTAIAAVSNLTGMVEKRAIRTEFTYVPKVGSTKGNGPAIGGNKITLGFNGSDKLKNHYSAYRSSLGKPVWNPVGYYKAKDYPDLWTTDPATKQLVTNCFDDFRVVALNGQSGCNIGAAHIYGHVASAGSVSWAKEKTAPDKPAAWVGEDLDPDEILAPGQRPYAGWTEITDEMVYGTQQSYGNKDTLIDGKCIEQGFTTMDKSWFTVPAAPTLDGDKVTDPGGAAIPKDTVLTRLGNNNGNGNFDNVNYNGGGTITWPASGEGAAYFIADNFDITKKSTLVVNGPVTVVVTGVCKFSQNGDADIIFGPKGSLTFVHTGGHAVLDYARSRKYTPEYKADGSLDVPQNQTSALASATDCYDPKKLRFHCTGDGDFVMHVNENNALMAAEIIAPRKTVRLHASTNKQSTFLGRILGNEVETTNGFDFFYDLDSGDGDGKDTTKDWVMVSWRQVVPVPPST